MRSDTLQPRIRAAALAAAFLFAACDGGGPAAPGGPDEPVLARVILSPDASTVQAGGTLQFEASGRLTDGSPAAVSVEWTATGGTVSSSGLYTAGQTAGNYRVIATGPNGLADTSAVTVTAAAPPVTPPPTPPQVAAVVVTPPTATVAAGGTVQFQAVGQLAGGGTTAVQVAWSATGGTVSTSGLYTAGQTAGSYRVVATGPNGLADTSSVTVTAPSAPPPPPPPSGNYATVAGDDWKGYANKTALRAADYFWWFETGDVYQYVDLVSDPLFGQAVRITFPRSSSTVGPAVRLQKTLPAPLDKAWYRWRVRFTPGFTTVGPDPAGHANSYKMAFWTWESHNGRGHVEFTNTDQYNLGFGVQDRATGQYLNYTETPLPGSQDFGRVTTEWTDGEWWEYVIYYEKTGPTSANQRHWRRRLTSGGRVVNNPWVFTGWSATGATTPRVAKVELGANKNKNNPTDMYLTWGPWEVVDGSRYPNPFGMPNMP